MTVSKIIVTTVAEITDPTSAEIARYLGGVGMTAGDGGTDPPPVVPPIVPTTDYYPADPYDAPYPSPAGHTIPSKPYLRDKEGKIFRLVQSPPPIYYPNVRPAGTVAGTQEGMYYTSAFAGFPCSVNGVVVNTRNPPMPPPLNDYVAIIYFTMLQIDKNGLVWGVGANNLWYNYASGNRFLPTGNDRPNISTAPPPVIAMPADPPKGAIQPGSTGRTILVGPSQAIKTLAAGIAAANAGDTLQLDAAVFKETARINIPLHIKGAAAGGTVISGAGVPLSAYPMGGRGGFVPNGVDCIVDDVEFSGGWGILDKTASDLTSAVRPVGPCWLVMNRCKFFDNQCGIGTDNVIGTAAPRVVVVLNDCEAARNGLNDGRSHNFYLGTDTVRAKVTDLKSTAPTNGHAFKFRGWGLEIIGGVYESAHGSPINIPYGTASRAKLTDITLNKAATDDNHLIISYASEGSNNGTAGMTVTGRIIVLCPNPKMQVSAGVVDMTGVTWIGSRPVVNEGSGTVTGMPI